jgi:membrane fusion protein, multidrug efflux system
LRAGLFAQASLTTEKKTGVKAVPLSAIRDNGGRTFVYLVKSGKLEERLVTLGLRDDNARASNGATGMVEILQGLEFGDSIVAANLGILRVGSTVTVGRKVRYCHVVHTRFNRSASVCRHGHVGICCSWNFFL